MGRMMRLVCVSGLKNLAAIAMMLALAVASVGVVAIPCSAHVGSPDIYFQGVAGPYHLIVTVRTPQMIPGVASIEVVSATPGITKISAVPTFIVGPGAKYPPAGDALVQIVVKPHRYFTREGADILLDLPITVKEVSLGAEVRTPTTTGSVMLKIPKRSNTGDVLRLRGKGVKTRGRTGDELVKLKVMMPTEAEPELDAFLADWKPAANYDPRKEM